MNKKTVEDIDVAGKRVLVRVDLNVPQDEAGKITDDTRISAALPTIQYLLEKKAKVVLVSHLGRPKGVTPQFTLEPVAIRLEEMLGQPVELLDEDFGQEVAEYIDGMEGGTAVLLENVRFHPEEEANDPEFAKRMSMLADVYVNDAFGTAHRAHASTEGVAHFIPAVAGFLMKKELDYLGSALDEPKRPFVSILGGKKVKDKISVIKQLLTKVDTLIVGGGMAYTFLKAKGFEIGNSLLDESNLEFCKEVLATAGDKLLLPVDVVVTNKNPFDVGQDACETKVVSSRLDSGGLGRRGHRPGNREALLASHFGSGDGRLERSDGHLRVLEVRRGHDRRGESPLRVQRDHDHRRRRFGGGGASAGLQRQNDSYLDGRRGLSGVSGGQDASGRGGVAG